MIDPEKVTDYNKTDKELEEFILFWVCAAGKNGRTAARCLDKLLIMIGGYVIGPFEAITEAVEHSCSHGTLLPELLKTCGIGCYTNKARTFQELVMSDIDLRHCTVTDLESIHGIGPKTARCFLLHSRENAQVAGLDTHMLKHLKALGHDVPKSTPAGKTYLELERIVLHIAEERNMTPAQLDLKVWNEYSIKSTPTEN